ncbi:DUF993 family protein [Streptomyces sp. NPDC051109]|uniref:DUF993 family protein n=1 Tax=Streptomyces sp. NPDC051109 TaxID=3365642 RepID=UPI0010D2296F
MIKLPEADGTLTEYHPNQSPRVATPDSSPFRNRSPLATAHILGDPLAGNEPFGPPMGPPPPAAVDWDATLEVRRNLWKHGFTLAEALDTAHRGMGLDWPASVELINRSAAEAKAVGGKLAVAVTTDQLNPFAPASLEDITKAYEQQLEVVEGADASAIIMCSPQLAPLGQGPDAYAELYGSLLRQVSKPAVLHWVASDWNPGHTGYWGHQDLDAALDTLIDIAKNNADKVDGIKIAALFLTPERQVEIRRRLPEGIRFYTSDTENYSELLVGDEQGFSDGLTPVFGAFAPIAAEALRAADAGDLAQARALLDPTQELSRHLFSGFGRSIIFFKTGLAFLGWLRGETSHYQMVWGESSARSLPHLAKLYRIADSLGTLPDPALAERRFRAFLGTYGIEQ